MIRRWSYINNLNNINNNISLRYYDTQQTKILHLLKISMYYDDSYYEYTKYLRPGWQKRKHHTNWINLYNILIDWSREYSFFKQYNRLVYFQYFFKNVFLAHNLISVHNSTASRHFGANDITSGSITRKMFSYYWHFYKYASRFTFFNQLHNCTWSYISTFYDLNLNEHDKLCSVDPLSYDRFDSCIVDLNLDDEDTIFEDFCSISNSLIFNRINEIYKISSLLIFMSIHKCFCFYKKLNLPLMHLEKY